MYASDYGMLGTENDTTYRDTLDTLLLDYLHNTLNFNTPQVGASNIMT